MLGFDIFAKNINLTFKKQETQGSYFGLFMTCVVIGFTIFLFYYFSRDLFLKTNPKITKSETLSDYVNAYIIDGYTFPLVIGFENKKSSMSMDPKGILDI